MMTPLAEKKKETRKRHLAIRQSLQPGEWKQKSETIIHRLISSDVYTSSETVHTYVSMESNREVQTIDFINSCFNAGKEVIVPRMKSDGKLTHHRIFSTETLSKNKWGVYEPPPTDEVQLNDGLLVVVPMVAADFQLNRLGYGKGYYDRFLSSITSKKSIGLCFNCNLSWSALPVEPFDIQMDSIITNMYVL